MPTKVFKRFTSQAKDTLRGGGVAVIPTANLEGESPALTIKKAYSYFGDKVDCYVDKGKRTSLPSTLIKIRDREIEVIRGSKDFAIK
jgi:tRNA A37 threonylcarbamoyladenosine synthetase subunit TsaC/SUA5/YrdC